MSTTGSDLAERRSVARNLSALAVAELVARASQLAIVAILGRRLGAAGMGVIGTGWALYAIALPWVQSAPELVGIRELSLRPFRISIAAEINALKLVAAAVAFAGLSAFAGLVYAGRSDYVAQVAAQASALLAAAFGVGWVFRALEQVEVHAVLRVVYALLAVLALGVLLSLRAQPLLVPAVEFALQALVAGAGFAVLRRRARRGRRPLRPRLLRWRSGRPLRRYGPSVLAQGVAGVSAAATWSACIPIAGLFLSTADVGIVTAALRLCLVTNGTLLLGIQLFLPRLTRALSADSGHASELVGRLLLYATLCGVGGAAALGAAAAPLCRQLLGPEFAAAAGPVRIAALALVPASAGAVFGYAILAAHRDRVFTLFMLAGAAATVLAFPAAFAWARSPLALAVLPAVLALQTAAMGAYVFGSGLLRPVAPRPVWLAPTELRAFLGSR
jgi:O-antigen/teichoic acid export membrane protein